MFLKKLFVVFSIVMFLNTYSNEMVHNNYELPLFIKFPKLKKNIPYIPFCTLPTPIIKLNLFSKILNLYKSGYNNIYMKCDFISGTKLDNGNYLYGGNKPRKLCFLLADAIKKNAKTIITYGKAGSNHALATAVYANQLGLKSILMLKDQPNSPIVRQNLLLDFYNNAQLKYFSSSQQRNIAKDDLLKQDNLSYFIPLGGSNELGVLGFVNAALELKEQINSEIIPEPDYIYVAAGSFGTIAGLLLGMKIANLKSKIIAVAVEPEEFPDQIKNITKDLFLKTNNFLYSLDNSIKLFDFPEERLIIYKKFCSTGYGLYTQEDKEIIKLFKEIEQVDIEGTYSSKPICAIKYDLMFGSWKKEKITKKNIILFWNTYCGLDFSNLTKSINYKDLPIEFHKYFEDNIGLLNKY